MTGVCGDGKGSMVTGGGLRSRERGCGDGGLR